MGQSISPFSLQSGHLTVFPFRHSRPPPFPPLPVGTTSFRLPLHLKQGRNLAPPHPSQAPLCLTFGSPSTRTPSPPSS
ncbi:hypothetical protein IEQ34_015060 [Dendrobium chrysotoxum]|uniref:Uncharacterized protein n=1 Tax=Dendrobium chrysotoxum TaxID=161865 RepID=A0AAV7GN69_DENCH|nr:hypothetical protein IEQ34_015060 [Dendrobium chrysotoxum]